MAKASDSSQSMMQLLAELEQLRNVHAAFTMESLGWDVTIVVSGFVPRETIDQISNMGFDLHSQYITENGKAALHLY